MKKLVCMLLAFVLLMTGCAASKQPAPEEPEVSAPQTESQPDAQAEVSQDAEPNPQAGPVHLVLGGLGMTNENIDDPLNGKKRQINDLVTAFNASQDDVVVELRDYLAEEPDLEQADARMWTELEDGNGPDILYFPEWVYYAEDAPSTHIFPMHYIGSGKLLDLDSFVEQDSELSPDDFLIWKALHQYGGMYLLGNGFSVKTLYCSSAFYDQHQNWTIQDLLDVDAGLTDEQALCTYMTPEYFIWIMGSRYLPTAMDFSSGTCDFLSDTWLSILNGAMQIKSYSLGWEGKPDQQLVLDGTLMAAENTYDSPAGIAYDRKQSGGVPLAYIGWPTVDGSNGTDISLFEPVGISSDTEHPDECWQFVRYVLTHWWKNPDPTVTSYGPTPIYAPSLEEWRQESERHMDYAWTTDQTDVEQLLTLAKESETLAMYDHGMMVIVLEEAKAMLNGSVTPEQAAQQMQQRATAYMQEQYG